MSPNTHLCHVDGKFKINTKYFLGDFWNIFLHFLTNPLKCFLMRKIIKKHKILREWKMMMKSVRISSYDLRWWWWFSDIWDHLLMSFWILFHTFLLKPSLPTCKSPLSIFTSHKKVWKSNFSLGKRQTTLQWCCHVYEKFWQWKSQFFYCRF